MAVTVMMFLSTFLILTFEVGLCHICDEENEVDPSIYLEESFESLHAENTTLKLLNVHLDDIYTAGNNGIFHLSKNLEIKSKHLTDEKENIYKILEVAESLGKLVACSSGDKGGCQLRNLSDVSVNSTSTNTALHENVVASGEFRTVGRIAPAKAGEGSSLYVARSIDLEGDERTDRPVFERKLMGRDIDDRQTNGIGDRVTASFVIYYSDAFSYGGFVYYLASQRDDATREISPIVSKLSRICQNDASEELKAFAELQLACAGEDGSLYSITQSAQRIGNDLFIVFNKNGEELHEYNPQPHSALCVYNMTEIEGKFEENSYACACKDGDNSNNNYLHQAICGLFFTESPGFPGCDSLRDDIGDIRDKFPCSANIGSTKFFAYPEEPQGQAVSADARYESTDLTFSSLSVTTVPRNDSQRIAFIGTKEGLLLKINLDQEARRNYEVIRVGFPILGDTTLYNNESLLVLTESKLLKIKVANCSQFTTCYECIRTGTRLGDPYCGWCTLERRCTRYNDCPNNNDISRWLSYNEMHCSAIAEVTPKSLPREDQSRKLQLKTTNVPELKNGEFYECHFNDWITTATVAADVINCTSPPLNEIPVVATGDHVTMQLQIFSSETRKTFVTKDYEFYDCSRIASCSDCVTSKWKCDWCILKHMCTYDSSSCDRVISGAHGSPSNFHSESCPQITPGQKKLVPSGIDQVLSIQAKNLPLLSHRNGVDYECHLISEDGCCDDVDFVTHATLATVDNITFTVTCSSKVYSYMKLQQTLDAKLILKWKTENAVDNFQPVQLYKCEVDRPDCSRCLSPATTAANLNCVWCIPSRSCTVGDKCEGQKTLPGSGVCPAPRIDKVSPSSSSLGGGTHVTVTGSDLGRTFGDIISITLAGEECIPVEDSYRVGESITCVAGPTDNVTDGGVVTVQILQQSGSKSDSFSYKDPYVGLFSPQSGPQSGGTSLEIIGEDLDTGGFVDVSIGSVQCILLSSHNAESITCKTLAAEMIFSSTINVTFDKTESKFSGNEFSFKEDPTIESVEPHRSIKSGGINLTVTGTNFDLIQRPQIIATFGGREIASRDCWMQISTELQCPSPSVNFLPSRRKRQTEIVSVREDVVIGFMLDGVTSLLNWTTDNGIDFQYFEDPKYFSFKNNETTFMPDSQDIIQIQGKNLDVASRREDVKVYIGKDECIITVLDKNQLYCEPPKEQPEAGDVYGNRDQRGLPFVVVHHGLNLRFDIGYVRYIRDPVVYFIIGICVAVILCLTIVGLVFRYVSRDTRKQVDKLLLELDYVKTNVSKELKIFYDTLQTALDKFEASRETMVQLKMTDRNQYVTKLLFISTSMELKDLTEPQSVTELTEGMTTFSELISMDNFLTGLIRVIDNDSQLSDEQRSKISSLILLCSLLEGNLGHLAHAMKILMSEKIEKADHSLYHQLFRGNSTIFDRLLLKLVAICLYDTLSIEIADKILQLFTATKCIIETGPVDAVTGKTQFSLSFLHMLESQIEFKELKLNVLFKDECDRVVELSFLNVDTITQVKTKILDYFSQGRFAQLQHTPEQFDLVLCNKEDEDRILTDDGILQLSNGWRKINTLSDYEVKDGACVELVKKLNNSQKDNKKSEVKHYSYADVDGSWSRNNQHLEAAEGTISDEGYIIPDDGYLVPDEGYLEPDVNQVNPTLQQGRQTIQDDGSYLTNNDNRVFTEVEKRDSLSKPTIKYYYPDDNPDQRKISPREVDSVYDEPEGGFGLWVWHLIKDDRRIRGRNPGDQIDENNLEDIVRPFLPATGSVLQKYVKNVFDAFMNSTGSHVSCVVKDLFDFFDRKATEQMAPELSNKWKSNVLFLKVYSTILTKPTIICDVKEYSYVQECLTVINQTMGEICTNTVVGPDDLRGQLFSQLVPVYRKKLDDYFKQITKMKSIDTETLENEYSRVAEAFTGTYDLLSAQYQLYTMLQRHIDQVCEKSQADAELVRKVRHMQTALKKTTK